MDLSSYTKARKLLRLTAVGSTAQIQEPCDTIVKVKAGDEVQELLAGVGFGLAGDVNWSGSVRAFLSGFRLACAQGNIG